MHKAIIKGVFLLVLIVPAIFLATIGLGHQYRIHLSNKWQNTVELPAEVPEAGCERVVVFAPHCDDETLGVGGTIYQAVKAGAKVNVVLMTNGDGFRVAAERTLHRIRLKPHEYVRFAYHRQQETIRALSILGVGQKQVTFLGYPDKGLARMWVNHWDSQNLYKSYYTKRTSSPYTNTFRPNAPYCGESVVADIQSILRRFKPTVIYVPHPADSHTDHYGAYCLVMAAVEQLRSEREGVSPNLRVRTYLVHRGDWPVPRGNRPKVPLAPPSALVKADTKWSAMHLSPEAVEAKRRAIMAHKSQTDLMKTFLLSFVKRNELFGEVITRKVPKVSDRSILADGDTADWKHIPPAIQDATGDNVLRDFYKGADVQAVYLCSDSKNLYVRADFVRNLSKRIHYRVAIRGIGLQPDDDKKIIEIIPGRRTKPENQKYAWRNRSMELVVPLGSFVTDRQLFVAVETAGMKTSIDRTGWRVFELSSPTDHKGRQVAQRL